MSTDSNQLDPSKLKDSDFFKVFTGEVPADEIAMANAMLDLVNRTALFFENKTIAELYQDCVDEGDEGKFDEVMNGYFGSIITYIGSYIEAKYGIKHSYQFKAMANWVSDLQSNKWPYVGDEVTEALQSYYIMISDKQQTIQDLKNIQ